MGLPWSSPDSNLPDLLPNRPPWRSAPRALNPSWTGSFGLWGRPTTLAASPVWCATADWMAFLSRWMPPARSTALRTSTGQARFPTFVSGCLPFLSFSSLHVPEPAPPASHPRHALFWLTSLSSLACPLLSCAPPSLGSIVSLLQPWGLTTPLGSLVYPRKFAPRCSVCGGAIMPEPGQEETVRIVALDRSFHIGCYKCEVRGPGPGEKEFLGSGLTGYSRTQRSWPGGKLLLLS